MEFSIPVPVPEPSKVIPAHPCHISMSTKVLFVDPFYEGLAQNVEVVAWMMVIILVFNQHC